jgi:hypothetical protein
MNINSDINLRTLMPDWNSISYNFLTTYRYLVAILFFKSMLYFKDINILKQKYKSIGVNLEVDSAIQQKNINLFINNWKHLRIFFLILLLFACVYDSKSGILLAIVFIIQSSQKRLEINIYNKIKN